MIAGEAIPHLHRMLTGTQPKHFGDVLPDFLTVEEDRASRDREKGNLGWLGRFHGLR